MIPSSCEIENAVPVYGIGENARERKLIVLYLYFLQTSLVMITLFPFTGSVINSP